MRVTDALVRAFTSAYADEAEVRRRLEAFAQNPDDHRIGRAARVLGGAVRAAGPEAVLAASEAVFDVVAWDHRAFGTNEMPQAALLLLADTHARCGRASLLDTPTNDLTPLLGLVDAPARRALATLLVRWVELGDPDAEMPARELVATLNPALAVRGTLAYGPSAGRLAWLQLASLHGDTTAIVRHLLSRPGSYGMASAAAQFLAPRLGVTLASSGLDCERGGRSDLHGEELAALLELVAQHDRALFEELVADALDTPWIRPTLLRAYALDGVPADDEAGVYAPDGRGVEVRRFGRVVLVAKFEAKGAATVSSAKDEKTACKVYARKVADAEGALGAVAGPRKAAVADANALLAEAAPRARRYDLRRALRAGADPETVVGSDGWRALHTVARQDAACVRMLLAAGADVNAVTAHGVTPLYLALNSGAAPFLVASVQALVDAGAKNVTYGGRTMLAQAASLGLADAVEIMVGAGFDASEPAVRELATAGDHPHVLATLVAVAARPAR